MTPLSVLRTLLGCLLWAAGCAASAAVDRLAPSEDAADTETKAQLYAALATAYERAEYHAARDRDFAAWELELAQEAQG
ncbi:hypothetical protein [Nocardioides sp. GY 10127]|uniref:hypothetical protein n=1 Tax=Nocardioides sp. GY 10127 TaxID=2569762 RepID=UPI0010A8744E|nr:hypothetical protein [Nocardioides sp. GY 10127]TIC78810.1 hypothetical protein E8D37_19125 [Nocardioides sp. GY 10127]